MRVFKGEDAIRAFLSEFDEWLSETVDVYLLGGSAMTAQGLQAQTEDTHLAVAVTAEFEYIYEILRERGFTVTSEPTESFEGVGTTVELYHPGREFQLDLFERQVVGKVWITNRIQDRADEFWSGGHVTAFALADEDMFLLKAVAGGDVASGRRRDIEDMRLFAQRGLDYDAIVNEIDQQRPFNTGSTEAEHIRNRSHPLLAIETAVEHLAGLPSSVSAQVSAFATECEVEYVVLTAVADGINSHAALQERARSTVRTLSDDDFNAIDNAIERLVEKQLLIRADDATIRLNSSP